MPDSRFRPRRFFFSTVGAVNPKRSVVYLYVSIFLGHAGILVP